MQHILEAIRISMLYNIKHHCVNLCMVVYQSYREMYKSIIDWLALHLKFGSVYF